MANANAVGLNELPMEQSNPGWRYDPIILGEFHQVLTWEWREKKGHRRWRNAAIKVLH